MQRFSRRVPDAEKKVSAWMAKNFILCLTVEGAGRYTAFPPGCSAVGSALRLGRRSRRFKSAHPDSTSGGTCGRRQVVRHQPSKLIFAGPNPVARSQTKLVSWKFPKNKLVDKRNLAPVMVFYHDRGSPALAEMTFALPLPEEELGRVKGARARGRVLRPKDIALLKTKLVSWKFSKIKLVDKRNLAPVMVFFHDRGSPAHKPNW
jgi:hypothetical protein